MKMRERTTIEQHFSSLEDPRIERTKRHKLIDIITITICAVICGADSWVEIENYGQSKSEFLKKFLELPNGIPSHDTFGRVFSLLDPEQLQQCFLSWIKTISYLTQGEVVAIDGKTIRHSFDKTQQQSAIHMVSAWATENQLVLGQVKVDSKSNEITAIPELLKVLYLKGCIVTIDAMGCQRDIVSEIVAKEADYLITLKANQSTLYGKAQRLFQKAMLSKGITCEYSDYCYQESSHGRKETRTYRVLNHVAKVLDPKQKWMNLNSIVRVDYLRTNQKGKTTVERRYFITSLCENAETLSKIIRSHWQIENQLNWVLDVQFNEDDSRVRKDNAPANLAIIRQIALNLINQETSLKKSVKSKRNRAGWDDDYLLSIIRNIND